MMRKKLSIEELIASANKDKLGEKIVAAKKIKSALKTAKNCLDANLLYELFGRRRRERVVHEFFANFLENKLLKEAGRDAANSLFQLVRVKLKSNEDYTVRTEVENKECGIKMDILLKGTRSDAELAIELKIDSALTERQEEGYQDYLIKYPKARVMVVSPAEKLESISEKIRKRFFVYSWSDVRRILAESIEANKNNKTIKAHRQFFNQFIEGIGEL